MACTVLWCPSMRKKTSKKAKRTRPKAGKTTTETPGGFLRKQIYLQPEEWDALRNRAFDEERSHSDIVREALRRYLGLGKA